jgi:acyl carrier protein
VEPIGIHDNFFSLGGDSLQATRLITQVQQDYPTGLPLLALFFQQPTIAALSLHIATGRADK